MTCAQVTGWAPPYGARRSRRRHPAVRAMHWRKLRELQKALRGQERTPRARCLREARKCGKCGKRGKCGKCGKCGKSRQGLACIPIGCANDLCKSGHPLPSIGRGRVDASHDGVAGIAQTRIGSCDRHLPSHRPAAEITCANRRDPVVRRDRGSPLQTRCDNCGKSDKSQVIVMQWLFRAPTAALDRPTIAEIPSAVPWQCFRSWRRNFRTSVLSTSDTEGARRTRWISRPAQDGAWRGTAGTHHVRQHDVAKYLDARVDPITASDCERQS